MKPLAIDLFCGLGGWAEGLLAEGYRVVGFDIEQHDYGTGGYPAQLVLQDVLTLHGSQFRNAALIVASPPCQAYSYMAMPFTRGRAKAAAIREGGPEALAELNALFDACFRIQREASEAAGRYIPMVVENVKGAQPWVGRAKWHYGSFYLWGDVPALMPPAFAIKNTGGSWFGERDGKPIEPNDPRDNHPGKSMDGSRKRPAGGSWFGNYAEQKEGLKQGGNWWHDPSSMTRQFISRSPERKAASAMIAKIPLPLARWIARVYHPATMPAGASSR